MSRCVGWDACKMDHILQMELTLIMDKDKLLRGEHLPEGQVQPPTQSHHPITIKHFNPAALLLKHQLIKVFLFIQPYTLHGGLHHFLHFFFYYFNYYKNMYLIQLSRYQGARLLSYITSFICYIAFCRLASKLSYISHTICASFFSICYLRHL